MIIKIIASDTETQSSQSRKAVEIIKADLYSSGFDVETLKNIELDPRGYIHHNPGVHHLIANIVSVENNYIQAGLYAGNEHSPKEFKGDSLKQLSSRIENYLI